MEIMRRRRGFVHKKLGDTKEVGCKVSEEAG